MFKLLLYFLSLLIFFQTSSFLYSSSRKSASEKPESQLYRAPTTIRKNIDIISNFDESIITPLLKFINTQTGLSCKLIDKPENAQAETLAHDLYIGTHIDLSNTYAQNYSSDLWKDVDPFYYKNGVYTWSLWYSCTAYNSLLIDDIVVTGASALEKIVGKLTTINPTMDHFLFLVFYTLYQTYGDQILVDMNRAIPLYENSREELLFSIESGQYPVVIGIDGYFRVSIAEGYPIELLYSSFYEDKYPVTTVAGENIVYINKSSINKEGAQFVIDFMATEGFQTFLFDTYFTPIIISPSMKESDLFMKEPDQVLMVKYERESFEKFKKIWEEIVFPTGTRELLEKL